MNILVVGAGFSGCVIADRLSCVNSNNITVIDSRSHVGGNCYTERDGSTGVMIHAYGPHIFNTDNQEVWDYVGSYCEMMPYTNRVKALHNMQIYSFPLNLHTINQFFGTSMNPGQALEFIRSLGDHTIEEPENFEEQALKMIGRQLYEAFFYGYTKKQWGCEPRELPASILKRLPVRFNYNDNYYGTKLQGIPKEGYTPIFERMLDKSNVQTQLNTTFNAQFDVKDFDHVFYTGPIDAFFDYKYGRLSYRTVYFERHEATGDYQGNAVINYTDEDVPFTRVHEHKHFAPWERHSDTVYFKEYSKETGAEDVPYYPKRLAGDLEKLEKYQEDVRGLKGYTFLGRLATYRYMDMHHVIAEALAISKDFLMRGLK